MKLFWVEYLGSNKTRLHQLEAKNMWGYLIYLPKRSGRRILHTNESVNSKESNNSNFSISRVNSNKYDCNVVRLIPSHRQKKTQYTFSMGNWSNWDFFSCPKYMFFTKHGTSATLKPSHCVEKLSKQKPPTSAYPTRMKHKRSVSSEVSLAWGDMLLITTRCYPHLSKTASYVLQWRLFYAVKFYTSISNVSLQVNITDFSQIHDYFKPNKLNAENVMTDVCC